MKSKSNSKNPHTPKTANGKASRRPAAKQQTTAAKTPGNGGVEPAEQVTLDRKAAAKSTISNVCVYCGSGPGNSPVYAEGARTLGHALAGAGIGLVYGGGGLGLMGEVARATLEAGGQVTGIIPEFLTQKEHMLRDVDTLLVTKDMHERKRLMFEKSDAFVALPGGIGTLEELVEQLTWSQLGQHNKPIVVANIAGFWNPFLDLLAHMRDDQFIRNGINVRFMVVDEATAILPTILGAEKRRPGKASDTAITAKF
ncbi:MAG: TIGR00730 family Rossman fold protein [Hyphomicrobiaceae bacterium]|nr:TIGR00730 family Rossman fold protein [Hyphomicrobiaceae bacterium]MCC0010095.1 TIGR00730 family Rossman fold protein [Hyphomicrobiaceae bacterium]